MKTFEMTTAALLMAALTLPTHAAIVAQFDVDGGAGSNMGATQAGFSSVTHVSPGPADPRR